jgi:hypothetical protein
MSQIELVIIIQIVIQTSHHQFRDSKQTDKVIIDLATRFFSFKMKSLLVYLLNEANIYVRKTYQSKKEQKILRKDKKQFVQETVQKVIQKVPQKEDQKENQKEDQIQNQKENQKETQKKDRKVSSKNSFDKVRKCKKSERYAKNLLRDKIYRDYDFFKKIKLALSLSKKDKFKESLLFDQFQCQC